MDNRIERVAALANTAFYDSEKTRKYIDGALYINHQTIRQPCGELVVQVLCRKD
jgi:hypothetical protein